MKKNGIRTTEYGQRKKSGMVFITALMLMVIFLALGLAYMSTRQTEMKISNNQMDALGAFYAAEAGIEHSMAEIGDNVDTAGDGIGNVSGSLGDYSYSAVYDNVSSPNTIICASTGPLAERTIKVEVTEPLMFLDAMQAGNSIEVLSTTGSVNGSINTGNIISLDNLSVNGEIIEHNESITVPEPDFNSYEAVADYTYSGDTVFSSSPADGMHYINGNLQINGGGSITLNGSIIAAGDITIDNCSDVTITASGNYPAVLAGQEVIISNLDDFTITGFIYGGQIISLSSLNTADIDGAVICSNSLNMDGVNNITVTFDPDTDPPYFSGPASVRITSWKGYE